MGPIKDCIIFFCSCAISVGNVGCNGSASVGYVDDVDVVFAILMIMSMSLTILLLYYVIVLV